MEKIAKIFIKKQEKINLSMERSIIISDKLYDNDNDKKGHKKCC